MDLTVEFFDKETGGPIASFSGEKAAWLFEHSQLLQTLREFEPEETRFVVPVDFPSDRVQIFRKVLKKIPIGTEHQSYWGKYYTYNTLGPMEEAAIQKNINEGRLRQANIEDERERVIQEVLHFLMLDREAENSLMVYRQHKNKNENEQKRRNRITRKRRANKNYNLGYLNEDTIDKLIEEHKNLLYSVHRYKEPEAMRLYLSKKNSNTRNKRQQNFEDRLVKESTRRARARQRGNYNNYNNYNNNWNNNQSIHGPFNNTSNTFPYELFENVNPIEMTSVEFERYLRSKLRKGEELALPYQGNLRLNTFFQKNNKN